MKPRAAFLLLLIAAITSPAVAQETQLPIPPLAVAERESGTVGFRLRPAAGESQFVPDLVTPTLGYNGNYLGPTIRVRRGDDVVIHVTNDLDEPTTVHWHGLFVPAESDGGPHQSIDPGDTWRAAFTVRQQAATLWYHPHPIGKTGEQVYRGLAGLLIIDDEVSDSLGLPSEYGVNDIPLILQDRSFDATGRFVYVRGMPDVMHGIVGDELLVNGAVDPIVELPRELVRLRVLNGSDSNVFRLHLQTADGPVELNQIATDGGLIAAPHATDNVILATGERSEIVIDLREFESGQEIELIAHSYQGPVHRALRIQVGGQRRASGASALPEELAVVPEPEVSRRTPERDFVMSTMGPLGQLTINGTRMDMDRTDFRIPRNTTEIWNISNRGMGMMALPHTFHIHNGQFLVLDVDGNPPPPELSGWKDTFLVWPNQVFRVVVRFEDYLGLYMYHCHFLVHEDAGMMGQFEIVTR